MALKDTEMHVVAALGACILSAALALPTIWWVNTGGSAHDDGNDDKHVIINASLAMLKSPKKQPQKQFRQPQPEDKPKGVSRDEHKVVDKQCCKNEADCNQAKLPLGTSCAPGLLCDEHNMCVKPKRDKPDKSDDKPVTIPDRTGGLDEPVGNPTDNTAGAFDGSKHGLAKTNSGDPWFARLSNDFFSFLEFPKLEAASAAEPCVKITPDGKIDDTEFRSNKRSDNEGLNAKISIALKKLQDKRNANPEPVPTHLLKAVTSQWTCFPVDNQTRQQD